MPVKVEGDVRDRLFKVAKEVSAATPTAVTDAAQYGKDEILKSARRVTPTLLLRNVGKSGSKLGVNYKLERSPEIQATVRATGAWQLIEADTSGHFLTSKFGGSSRARRAGKVASAVAGTLFGLSGKAGLGGGRGAVLKLPWGYRRWAYHPGTKGRRPWAKGRETATPGMQRIVENRFRRAFLRGAKG